MEGVAGGAGGRLQAAAEHAPRFQAIRNGRPMVMPGRGLPSGPMTARPAVKAMLARSRAIGGHAEQAERPDPWPCVTAEKKILCASEMGRDQIAD